MPLYKGRAETFDGASLVVVGSVRMPDDSNSELGRSGAWAMQPRHMRCAIETLFESCFLHIALANKLAPDHQSGPHHRTKLENILSSLSRCNADQNLKCFSVSTPHLICALRSISDSACSSTVNRLDSSRLLEKHCSSLQIPPRPDGSNPTSFCHVPPSRRDASRLEKPLGSPATGLRRRRVARPLPLFRHRRHPFHQGIRAASVPFRPAIRRRRGTLHRGQRPARHTPRRHSALDSHQILQRHETPPEIACQRTEITYQC